MKKLSRIILIVVVNVLLLILFIFISDFLTYKIDTSKPETPDKGFKYFLKNPIVPFVDLEDYFNGKDDILSGRTPVGMEYKNEPILFFGDSYIHGQYLKFNQNFGYKLSHTLKRPVFNRAIPGSGFQHMFFQVNDEKAKCFYEQVPPTSDIFYIIIHDHYLRMLILSDFGAAGGLFHLRYTIKDGKLVKDDYENVFLNLLKSSHTIRNFHLKFLEDYIHRPRNGEKITNEAVKYFVETRKILENKWNRKINFTVIFYDNFKISHQDMLKKKLEDNGFKTLVISELTNENLNSEKYLMQDNLHPTEEAWNLLTPLIIEKLELKKI